MKKTEFKENGITKKNSQENEPMNLCLIAPRSSFSGGVSNWERILSAEIRKHDSIKVFFINNVSMKRPTDGGTMIYRIFHGSYVMLRAYVMLCRFVRKEKIDVVHMTTSGGLGFVRDNLLINYLNKKKIPCVYHIHFGRAADYRNSSGRKWRQLLKAVRHADCTIAIDDKTYHMLQTESKRMEYVNNPIDIESYKKYNITNEHKAVFIGWMIKEKGIEELIQAFCKFNRNGEYELELIGPGKKEYMDDIRSKYHLDHIHLLGELEHEEAMAKLAGASFLVLPSYTEGFPNVILEAMALHKPVIASSVGAIPQMLAGGAGLLVEAKDIDGLQDAMQKLADVKLQNVLGENAYKRTAAMYDVKMTFDKYHQIWMELAESANKKKK